MKKRVGRCQHCNRQVSVSRWGKAVAHKINDVGPIHQCPGSGKPAWGVTDR